MGINDREKKRENMQRQEVVKEMISSPIEQTNVDYRDEKIQKKGRPKLTRETKKKYNFTVLPSIHEKASDIASLEGKSLSEVVSGFLEEYVKKNQNKREK